MDTFDSLKIGIYVGPFLKNGDTPPHFTPPKMIIFNRKTPWIFRKGCFPPFFGKKKLTYLDVDQPQDPPQH